MAFPHFFPQLWKTSGGDPTAQSQGTATVAHGSDALTIAHDAAADRLTLRARRSLLFTFLRHAYFDGQRDSDIMKRTFPAEPPSPHAHARLSGAHGHEERPARPEAPPRQGPQAPDRFLPTLAQLAAGRRRATDMPSERFGKGRRVRRRAEFQRVYDRAPGSTAATSHCSSLPNAAGSRAARHRGHPEARRCGRAGIALND